MGKNRCSARFLGPDKPTGQDDGQGGGQKPSPTTSDPMDAAVCEAASPVARPLETIATLCLGWRLPTLGTRHTLATSGHLLPTAGRSA